MRLEGGGAILMRLARALMRDEGDVRADSEYDTAGSCRVGIGTRGGFDRHVLGFDSFAVIGLCGLARLEDTRDLHGYC